jgi:adenylate cyclase
MPAEVWRFEDFELDPSAYRLLHKDRIVRLERIPFELLCLLVERGGQLVTREEILERVWGMGVFVDSETSINTAVRKIRRVLNDDADAPRFIVTVRARGYRFVAPIHETNATAATAQDGASAPVRAGSPRASAAEESGPRRWKQVAAVLVGLALGAVLIPPALHHLLRSEAPAVGPLSAQNPPLPLPDKPSIAVLPFTNLSGDREQEYFSDGVTDDLIATLSRLPGLFVIARTSSFTFKGKAAKAQNVGRDLGVQYVLEGSVRKAENQVRITAQLADATSGEQLWAEHYDRTLKDIFALQDEIVGKIVTTLNLQLGLAHKIGYVQARRTDNIEAYDYELRGWADLWILTGAQANVANARRMFQKAIELDPKYADAYAGIGFTELNDWTFQWSSDPNLLDRALEFGHQAIALDDTDLDGYVLLAAVEYLKGQFDQAIVDAKRSITIDPNYPFGYIHLANALIFSGRPSEGIEWLQKAMRRDPRKADMYFFFSMGAAYFAMGRYQDSVSAFQQSLNASPNSPAIHVNMAVDYIELHREDDARAEVAEALRINPRFSPRPPTWKDQALYERVIADRRKAGLK